MTHDELVARLDGQIASSKAVGCDCLSCDNAKALRAVVELHKPVQSYMFEEEACSHCSSEEDRVEILYPCPTIQAIEKELQ